MTSNIFYADRVEMLSLDRSIKQLYTSVKRKLSYTSTSAVDFGGKKPHDGGKTHAAMMSLEKAAISLIPLHGRVDDRFKGRAQTLPKM